MTALSRRISRVRITCGDWRRVITPAVTRAGAGGDRSRAILLDPPYATSGDLYAESSTDIAKNVRTWCEKEAAGMRVILCGYDTEHDELLNRGWTVTNGRSGGGAGYSANPENGRRERLWMSPECLSSDQLSFEFEEPA